MPGSGMGHPGRNMKEILNLRTVRAWYTITVFLCCVSRGYVEANRGYLVAAPAVFRSSTEEVLSVSILEPSEPVRVEAKLFAKHGQLITETAHEIFGKGTLKLKIPPGVRGRCTLKICGNCISPKDGSLTFYNSTTVDVMGKGASAFIQTDKPVYKPGQTVQINVIITGPDLLPVNEPVSIYLLDPRRSRMIEWRHIRPACCGLVNVTYPISDQPVLGEWTAIVRLQSQTYNKSFEIQTYVLPKFEVSIEPPNYIQNWTECQPVFVRARYWFGKSVRGKLIVHTNITGENFRGFTAIKVMKIHGLAVFNVCVSEMMPKAKLVRQQFKGILNIHAEVHSPDGSTSHVVDSSCPVHKQLISLEFSRDTPQYFKPGLPFRAKLLVRYPDGSPADNVTVQVRAEVNDGDTTVHELVSAGGTVTALVPNTPPTAQSMLLETYVSHIVQQPIPHRYMAASRLLGSWYSPSSCHIGIEPVQDVYRIGNEAKFHINSTCVCNFTLFYEVMGRGNLVHSGIHFARHLHKAAILSSVSGFHSIHFQSDQPDVSSDVKTCSVHVKFPITHEMSPLSRLLVYYVRPDGEGVADAFTFSVQPAYRNTISIELSAREASPGDPIQMHIHTRPGSCVCVGAIDKSFYLLKPGHELSTEQIFDELESYDISLTNGNSYLAPSGANSPATWWHSRDSQHAFDECGLLVMTDVVSLLFKQSPLVYSRPFTKGLGDVASLHGHKADAKAQSHLKKRKRTYFPETWIWTCFNASSTRKDSHLKISAPDSITTWVVDGVSISPSHGLALADPVHLKTFKHFFIDFTMPDVSIRGEQIKVPLTVHNYLASCIKVHLDLHLPEAIHVRHAAAPGSPGRQRFCIGMEETKTIDFLMTVQLAGDLNVSAEAEAYSDSRCCSGVLTDEAPSRRDLIGYDSIRQPISIEPEGIRQSYTHSAYFCPNERLHVTTPNSYEFQYLARPDKVQWLLVDVKAPHDAHLALSDLPNDNNEMVEIVLGGWLNTESWIAQGKKGMKLANISSNQLLSGDEFRSFWITWNNGTIQVGQGTEPDEELLLLSVELQAALGVNFIGVSTGWGAEGEFRVWNRMDSEEGGAGEVFHLSLPPNTVPDSFTARAKVTGDILGPSLQNLGQLLRLPRGCGEQNMATFAPNIYVLKYLRSTGQVDHTVRQQAIDRLVIGYQRQLTYRRSNGSYSAFGENDLTGNMWLTAFVLRTLAEAGRHVYIDPQELQQTRVWVLNQQRQDGSFPARGRLINKSIQGGIHGHVALTAYVVTALLEAGVKSKMAKSQLIEARTFLESKSSEIQDAYTAALTGYALTRLHSAHALYVVNKLNHMAIRRDGLMYWKFHTQSLQEELLFNERPGIYKASSAEIEIAAYAVLTLLVRKDVTSALPIVKWLSSQRNPQGGFSSTQDTVVALNALAEYASQTHRQHLNLSLTLASTNFDLHHHFAVTQTNGRLLQTADVPSLPTDIFVSASGDGCALFQIDVEYSVPDPAAKPAFSLSVRVTRQHARRHAHPRSALLNVSQPDPGLPNTIPVLPYSRPPLRLRIQVCIRWMYRGSSNMAVLQVALLTGFLPDMYTLEQLMHEPHIRLKRYELDGRNVLFYFDEIHSDCTLCVSFEAYREFIIGRTHKVPVKVYDYYEPAYESHVFYNASHIVELVQELCEEEECNQIMEDVHQPAPEEVCNSVLGCGAGEPARCTCERVCELGQAVCGSDGLIHRSQCHLATEACRQDVHIEVLPLKYCQQDGATQDGPSSDDLSDGVTANSDEVNANVTVVLDVNASHHQSDLTAREENQAEIVQSDIVSTETTMSGYENINFTSDSVSNPVQTTSALRDTPVQSDNDSKSEANSEATTMSYDTEVILDSEDDIISSEDMSNVTDQVVSDETASADQLTNHVINDDVSNDTYVAVDYYNKEVEDGQDSSEIIISNHSKSNNLTHLDTTLLSVVPDTIPQTRSKSVLELEDSTDARGSESNILAKAEMHRLDEVPLEPGGGQHPTRLQEAEVVGAELEQNMEELKHQASPSQSPPMVRHQATKLKAEAEKSRQENQNTLGDGG